MSSPQVPDVDSQATPSGARAPSLRRPARRAPVSPSRQAMRSVSRAVRDRRNRKVVVGCVPAAAFLTAFGVFATTQGPPPKSEAVVYFDPAATVEQKEAVRAACPTVGNAVQLPPDTGNLATSRVYPLRYDVSRASSRDRADLYRCVSGQPGVVGINTMTQGQ